MPTAEKNNFNYAQSLRELEAITLQLEQGTLELPDAIAQFEVASKLAAELQRYLDSAELKIKNISKNFENQPHKTSEQEFE